MDDSVNESLKAAQKTVDDMAAKTRLLHLKSKVINNLATDADREELASLEESLRKSKDPK